MIIIIKIIFKKFTLRETNRCKPETQELSTQADCKPGSTQNITHR